jgi:hypothetical protein
MSFDIKEELTRLVAEHEDRLDHYLEKIIEKREIDMVLVALVLTVRSIKDLKDRLTEHEGDKP